MQGFEAEVLLRNDEGTEAEANSVIALLMLDSAKGRQIEVEATGPQGSGSPGSGDCPV
ncbi:phosphohistidinoprotein-hexose phosphotransferase component of N-regulated PTS system (Npr) [Citrobacter freundii]|nr:phosphohistidinoprotein-hexose phosphotransferase component of N-regulated PTS system (Npr) [Citrobacter freundii]